MLTRLVFVGVLAHAAYVSATGPDDIPVAGSQVIPGEAPCGLPEMPDPVLAACDVGLHPTVPDHRGSWVSNTTNHTERIEQCEGRFGPFCILVVARIRPVRASGRPVPGIP